MSLTNRQWRALAQAYPYYFPSAAPTTEEATALPHDDISTQKTEFAQYVVPRVAKAFADAPSIQRCAAAEVEGRAEATGGAVERLLDAAFGRRAIFRSGADTSAPSCTPVPLHAVSPSLTDRELQLLGLYYRKQQQYEYVQSTQQRLLEASQSAVRGLQSTMHCILAEGVRHSEAGGLLDRSRESLQWLGGQPQDASTLAADVRLRSFSSSSLLPSGCSQPAPSTPQGDSRPSRGHAVDYASGHAAATFTSALASVPYVSPSSGADSVLAAPATANATTTPLMVVNRCAGCGEADGDLMVCTQCGEVRHEACGGPHPPERSRIDGSLPSINVCRRCARELNLSSSSSSLDSATSSSERAELEDYFDSEEDSDSSLSGFVVHSSDEEEEEDDEEEEENATPRSGSSSGSESSRKADEEGRRRRDGRRDVVDSRRRSERRRNRRRRAESTSDEDDENNNSASARKRSRKHQSKKRPRKEKSRAGRSSSDEDSASASSSLSSSFSASFPSPPQPARHNGAAKASSSTPVKGDRGKSNRRKDMPGASPLSTQERRRRQDEEDELSMLGIAAHSPAASRGSNDGSADKKKKKHLSSTSAQSDAAASPPPSQPQQRAGVSGGGGKGGRRSVVNVASSSSSSSSESD